MVRFWSPWQSERLRLGDRYWDMIVVVLSIINYDCWVSSWDRKSIQYVIHMTYQRDSTCRFCLTVWHYIKSFPSPGLLTQNQIALDFVRSSRPSKWSHGQFRFLQNFALQPFRKGGYWFVQHTMKSNIFLEMLRTRCKQPGLFGLSAMTR